MAFPFRSQFPGRSRSRSGLIPGLTGRRAFLSLAGLAVLGSLLVFGGGGGARSWATAVRVLSVRGAAVLGRAWDGAWDLAVSLARAPAVRRENAMLLAQLQESRLREEEARRIASENARLRAVLGYAAALPAKALAARVVAVDPGEGGWHRSVWIDKGTLQGVHVRDAVRVPEGLVGQVILAEPDRAQVLMLTDPDFRAAAVLEASRVRGEVKGRGTRELDFVVLSAEDAAVPAPAGGQAVPPAEPGLLEAVYTPGETVVTSGLGGILPEGLAVGRVVGRREDPQGITPILTLVSAVNPAGLEFVFVIPRREGP